jgi:hypothetical protein
MVVFVQVNEVDAAAEAAGGVVLVLTATVLIAVHKLAFCVTV